MHSCALRALTLCDGSRLEERDHTLTGCICEHVAHCDERGYESMAALGRGELKMRIEELMSPPLF